MVKNAQKKQDFFMQNVENFFGVSKLKVFKIFVFEGKNKIFKFLKTG